jgi:hypothetical protein
MSNSKISALTSATTPLAGTEVLPIVQSSATTQVSVANLTAGRAVSALSYTSTTGATFATTSGSVGVGTSSPQANLHIAGASNATVLKVSATDQASGMLSLGDGGSTTNNVGTYRGAAAALSNGNFLNLAGYDGIVFTASNAALGSQTERMRIVVGGNIGIGNTAPQAKLQVLTTVKISDATQAQGNLILGDGGSTAFNVGLGRWNGSTNAAGAGGMGYFSQGTVNGGGHYFYTGDAAAGSTTLRVTIDPVAGDTRLATGNLIPVTAAKGVNFTANTPKAGMTSQLLNWYEEGTWTPAQGGGLVVVGAFSSSGTYTRIGRQVTVSGRVQGATSVALTAGGIVTNNIPWAAGSSGTGAAVDSTSVKSSTLIVYSGSFNVYSASVTTASSFVDFGLTYQI